MSEMQVKQLRRLVAEWHEAADRENAMAAEAPYESPMQMQCAASADSLASCADALEKLVAGWAK